MVVTLQPVPVHFEDGDDVIDLIVTFRLGDQMTVNGKLVAPLYVDHVQRVKPESDA